jgi:DNA-binding response OmpR family regulator
VTGRRILIVEDDEDLAPILAEALSDEGYRVETARNGLEGLRLAERELPDLIILDLMMPVMDGWQFREEQLKTPALASIPVLLTTADGHAVEKAKKLHTDGCLPKPLSLGRLLAEVARALSSHG